MSPIAKIIVAVAALLAAMALGYWGYGALKILEAQWTAVGGVKDASERLREALTIEAGPPAADRAQTVRKLDEHVAAVDRFLQKLKWVDASSDQALVDAADDYLLTAREILKRQADAHRYRLQWTESWQALREHMRNDDRTGAWVRQAVKARERANRDFRSYSIAARLFAKLLETLPASQKRIAPHFGPGVLIGNDLLAKARGRALQDAERAAVEMEWKIEDVGTFR